jgi:hypothetical protein
MRSSSRAALVLAVIGLATSTRAEDPFVLEFEPDPWGHSNSIHLRAFLTAPRQVLGVNLELAFPSDLIAQTTIRVPDAYKSSELVAEATLTSGGADVTLRYAGTGPAAPPAGQHVEAFTVYLCVATPTPPAGWDLPVEARRVEFLVAGEDGPVAGQATVPGVYIPWGSNNDLPFCLNEPPSPEFFSCETQPGGRVLLTWRNPVEYSLIEINLSNSRVIQLPGDATSWVHDDGASSNFVYSIMGIVPRTATRLGYSETVACAAEDPRPVVSFVRGDANSDGLLSTADILAIQSWLFREGNHPQCLDSADVDDDGEVGNIDQAAIAFYLFGMQFGTNNGPFDGGEQPPAPFPAPGPDPTHAGEASYLSCDAYTVTPGAVTEDVIRLGDVEALPGGEAFIPVYLTNAVPVEAVQLVVQYDPGVLRIASGRGTISYTGTHFEQFIGRTFTVGRSTFTYGGPHITQVDVHEEDSIFTASIVSHPRYPEIFGIEPGEETLIAKIRALVSPDVPNGTMLHVDPVNGPNGTGYGRFRLHNELTYDGDGRSATILPRQVGGILRIGVDGDISFFVRGDANGDKNVQISDAIAVLQYLFAGDAVLPCEDAADADDSGTVVITDGIVILNHLFGSGKPFPPPYPDEGMDPQPDFLKPCRAAD